MPNYDGRYEVVTIYDVTISSRSFEHRLTYDVLPLGTPDVGISPSDIDVTLKGGTLQPLDEAVADFTEVLWELFGTGTSQPRFELWLYDPEPSLNKTFITGWVHGVAFVLGASAAVAAHQATFTFRSALGGVARIQLMEDLGTSNARIAAGALTGDNAALYQAVISNSSPIVARDGAYLIGGIAGNFTQNEKLARKRFRTS